MGTELGEVIREKQARIAELRAELEKLEAELRDAKGLLTGRPVRNHRKGIHGGRRRRPIRDGSTVDLALRVLRDVGRPLSIEDLMSLIAQRMGKPVKKATLVSNLSRYVKAGDTFTRTAESTYGLLKQGTETSAIP